MRSASVSHTSHKYSGNVTNTQRRSLGTFVFAWATEFKYDWRLLPISKYLFRIQAEEVHESWLIIGWAVCPRQGCLILNCDKNAPQHAERATAWFISRATVSQDRWRISCFYEASDVWRWTLPKSRSRLSWIPKMSIQPIGIRQCSIDRMSIVSQTYQSVLVE